MIVLEIFRKTVPVSLDITKFLLVNSQIAKNVKMDADCAMKRMAAQNFVTINASIVM